MCAYILSSSAYLQALFQGMHPAMVQYLDVRIRRTEVLQDAMNQLMHRPGELKKPLRVTFISGGLEEEGLDEGGVTKEFFQLLIRQIFNEVLMGCALPGPSPALLLRCPICATLCCAVLCCAVLCCAVLCCLVLCCAVLCCLVLCCAASNVACL